MFRKYAKILQKNTHAELQFHLIKIALQDGCSPVNLIDVFQTVFYKNSPWGLLMKFSHKITYFRLVLYWFTVSLARHRILKLTLLFILLFVLFQ